MKTIDLRMPELGLFAITRAAFGIGVGLLLSSKLDERQRKAAGIALVLLGAITTIPFAITFLREDS